MSDAPNSTFRTLYTKYRYHPFFFLAVLFLVFLILSVFEGLAMENPYIWGKLNYLTLLVTENSASFLRMLGYGTTIGPNTNGGYRLWVDGQMSVSVAYHCNGLSILLLFATFILVASGKMKTKLWFIPLGLLSIHLINVARVSLLAITYKYHPAWVDFNHKYAFTVVVYSWIILLYVVWMKKYAFVDNGHKLSDNSQTLS